MIQWDTKIIPPNDIIEIGGDDIAFLKGSSKRRESDRNHRRRKNHSKRRYHWERSGFLPCSATCSTGIEEIQINCIDRSGRQVTEAKCNQSKKPDVVRRECARETCKPRWESSSWSECSVSCNDGVRLRKVHCWKFVKPGVDSTVHTIECERHSKPEVIKNCTSHSIGDLQVIPPRYYNTFIIFIFHHLQIH